MLARGSPQHLRPRASQCPRPRPRPTARRGACRSRSRRLGVSRQHTQLHRPRCSLCKRPCRSQVACLACRCRRSPLLLCLLGRKTLHGGPSLELPPTARAQGRVRPPIGHTKVEHKGRPQVGQLPAACVDSDRASKTGLTKRASVRSSAEWRCVHLSELLPPSPAHSNGPGDRPRLLPGYVSWPIGRPDLTALTHSLPAVYLECPAICPFGRRLDSKVRQQYTGLL